VVCRSQRSLNNDQLISSLPETLSRSLHGELNERYFLDKYGSVGPATRIYPQKGIFLCFSNRCGSTFVAAKASAAGFVGRPNEYLNFEFFNSDFMIEFCERNDIQSIAEYLDAIVELYKSPLDIFFSKVSVDQIAWLARVGVLGRAFRAPLFIHVVRRNILAQAISLSIAHQTREWTSMHPEARIEPELRVGEIIDSMVHISQLNSAAEVFFNITNANVIRFAYEEVVDEPDQIQARLEAALGVRGLPDGRPSLKPKKQASGRNAEWEALVREQLTRGGLPRFSSAPDS
jgi:LPS sulfotransferase NodH